MEKTEWPADNANAVDPLARHSLDRARSDAEYASTNREWYRWAEREVARRDIEQSSAARLEESNAALDAALSEREKNRASLAEMLEGEREKQRIKRNARLSNNVRRMP